MQPESPRDRGAPALTPISTKGIHHPALPTQHAAVPPTATQPPHLVGAGPRAEALVRGAHHGAWVTAHLCAVCAGAGVHDGGREGAGEGWQQAVPDGLGILAESKVPPPAGTACVRPRGRWCAPAGGVGLAGWSRPLAASHYLLAPQRLTSPLSDPNCSHREPLSRPLAIAQPTTPHQHTQMPVHPPTSQMKVQIDSSVSLGFTATSLHGGASGRAVCGGCVAQGGVGGWGGGGAQSAPSSRPCPPALGEPTFPTPL